MCNANQLKHKLQSITYDLKASNDKYEARQKHFECACCKWPKDDTEYRPEVKAKWCDDCFNDFHVSARADALADYETQEYLRYYGMI